jgi:secreted trypsin-like serine protease
MRVSFGASGLFVLWAAACGSSRSFDERTAVTSEAIQDGTADTTDKYPFAVAVIENGQQVGLCSGSLLAPNLVATARHCVTALSGPKDIDCATSTFGSDLPVGELLVTNDPTLSSGTHFVGVRQIVVPTGTQQTKVCGNDIALLILAQNIVIPEYVTPTLNPPMTDPRYSIAVTAIGYGIDSPLDTTGMSAGTRRVRENVGLVCVPNDASFLGCYSNPMVSQFLSPNEFVSGNASTCEGDSGSGAFDQGSFDRGDWVSFGVLSRGATDADSGTCVQPIYSRFDAWSQLLVEGVTQAATVGGYAIPAWAQSGPVPVVSSEAGASEAATLLGNGTACGGNDQCQSSQCVSTDNVHFICASACSTGVCSAGFSCVSGFCFEAANSPPSGAVAHKSGCSVGTIGAKSGAPVQVRVGAVLVVLALIRRSRPASRSQCRSRSSTFARAHA